MLKISKNYLFQIKRYCEGNEWILGIFSFVEMKISKLINYSTDMCWNGQGTTVFIYRHGLGAHLCSFFVLGRATYTNVIYKYKISN